MKWLALFFLLAAAPALAILLALLGLETVRTNLLGWILFCLGTVYPAGILIDHHAHPERYRAPEAEAGGGLEERGDSSFWLILPGFLTVFFASPLEWLGLAPLLPRPAIVQVVGIGIFVCGAALVVWARRSLRLSYSHHLAVASSQALVETGPYRRVRHPAYGGLLLMALGVAVGYSSAIAMAAIPVLLIPGLVYRIRMEERLLAARFGEVFAAYERRTPRLIPGVW